MQSSTDTWQWLKEYRKWEANRKTFLSPENYLSPDLKNYPFIENEFAPFTPARRAITMMNLGVISSAGIYIDGTEPFDTTSLGGDLTFREIPSEVEPKDLRFVARGYDPAAIAQDLNSEFPLERLFEFAQNRIIGQVNPVCWSFSGFIPDAAALTGEMIPKLVERVKRYDVQAVLLIPASQLCHQSVSLVARAIEAAGTPTMTLGVAKEILEKVRPPRGAFYAGELGSVAGKPNFPEHQRRVLDEALRLIEPMDQPGLRKLTVALESQVEKQRGER